MHAYVNGRRGPCVLNICVIVLCDQKFSITKLNWRCAGERGRLPEAKGNARKTPERWRPAGGSYDGQTDSRVGQLTSSLALIAAEAASSV